jgi:nucleoid DNA-binding protein
MKNLARHIELLLHDNDCVILPGFGGFIAHDVPAYYVSEEGLYYPPSRSISFNATITMNDGLLAQSYMKSYQVDYARANYMIDVAIEQLTDTLDEEGTVTLSHIGTLTQDINQSLQFIPVQGGIASPSHFGLGSFIIRELRQIISTEVSRKTESMTRTAKTFELHINKETFRRAMSVAAVFLLLLMVALPTGDHQPTDIASLQLTKIVSVPQIQSATNNIEFVTTTNEEPITTESKDSTIADSIAASETVIKECPSPMVSVTPSTIFAPSSELFEAPVTEPTPAAVATSKKTYHVIVASLPSHHGAKETLNKYIRMGYTEASLVERDNRVRVSLMQFTDKDEANHQIDILRQQKVFKNAWMLAVRN